MGIVKPQPPNRSRRPGPNPLPLHLAMARSQYASAQAAFAQMTQHRGATTLGRHWADRYGHLPKAAVSRALKDYCEQRLSRFLNGVEQYQSDNFSRPASQPAIVCTFGGTRVLSHGGAGQTILLVPSLINPSWILDLLPARSFAAFLVERGFHVCSIDWGQPGLAEGRFGLEEYCLARLVPAIAALSRERGPIHLIGYCLGGNIALAAALEAQRKVEAGVATFTAIAAPWDFSAMGDAARRLVAQTYHDIKPVLARTGVMPASALQALFAQLDPTQIERKFVRFGDLNPKDPEDRAAMDHFIAIEDWSNSGPDLAQAVVEETFIGFYGANTPAKGRWQVAGAPVDPSRLHCPAMVLAAGDDRIVPKASTLALARQLPAPHVISPNAGHVGMMVGSKAQSQCWTPVVDWLVHQSGRI